MPGMNDPGFLFTILSDLTRLRIVMLIQQSQELCVCEIMYALDESQPKISRHLAYMRRNGFVTSRREGTWMHYRIASALPAWGKKIIADTCRHLHPLEVFKADARRLNQMPNRPGLQCA